MLVSGICKVKGLFLGGMSFWIVWCNEMRFDQKGILLFMFEKFGVGCWVGCWCGVLLLFVVLLLVFWCGVLLLQLLLLLLLQLFLFMLLLLLFVFWWLFSICMVLVMILVVQCLMFFLFCYLWVCRWFLMQICEFFFRYWLVILVSLWQKVM